jgi:hypothetical protein
MDKKLFGIYARMPKDAFEGDEVSDWQAVHDTVAFDKVAATFAATDNSKVLKAWMDVQTALEKLSARVVIVEGVPTLELAKPANYVTVGATVTRVRATGTGKHTWNMVVTPDGLSVGLEHNSELWFQNEPAATYLQKCKAECATHGATFYPSQFKRMYESALAKAKGA